MFFATAVLVVCSVIPIVKKIAFKIGAVDEPSKRRVHSKTTARLGGVAIFLGIVACCVLAFVGVKYLKWEIPLSYNNSSGVNYIVAGFGALIIFITGVVDDMKCLPPKTKLILQIFAACVVCVSGLLFNRIYNPITESFIEFGWLSYPITIFYLVAFANIINLIDGLDGLAAGITAIAATTIFVFAIHQNKADAAILCLGIMGACGAFLLFNFNPAKIFMGDSGSLTLGFLLGIASLLAAARTAVVVSMLVPLMAAGIPIIDTAAAIIRRKRQNLPIDQADTGHIHHRLLKSGLSTKQTVLLMWAWTAFLSICGIIMTIVKDGLIDLLVLMIAIVFTAVVVFKLHLFEPVLKHHYNHRKKKHRKFRPTLYGLYNTKNSGKTTMQDDAVQNDEIANENSHNTNTKQEHKTPTVRRENN